MSILEDYNYSQREHMTKTPSLDSLPGNASKVLNAVADETGPKAQELRSRVNDTIATATRVIADARTNAADSLKLAASSTDEFVRENPWIAIGVTAGIAGAVGFLAGLVATPRKRFWT